MASSGDDTPAVPFEKARRLIKHMKKHIPTKNLCLMTEVLYSCGPRIVELDRMDRAKILKKQLWWPAGKNQRGWRHEPLSDDWLDRYNLYRSTNYRHALVHNRLAKNPDAHAGAEDPLFDIDCKTYSRRFKAYLKEHDFTEWDDRVIKVTAGDFQEQRLHTPASFRKTFITHQVAASVNAGHDQRVAVMKVRKQMKHSSENMTEYYYVQDLQQTNALYWANFTLWETIELSDEELCIISGGQYPITIFMEEQQA